MSEQLKWTPEKRNQYDTLVGKVLWATGTGTTPAINMVRKDVSNVLGNKRVK